MTNSGADQELSACVDDVDAGQRQDSRRLHADADEQQRRPIKTRTTDVTQLPASPAAVTFEGMLLPERLLVGLRAVGFVRPSPIQFEAIPVGRCGFDMVVQAKSGTGKTVVFSVVALEGVRVECRSVQSLVLAPTREIVVQISQVVSSLSLGIPAVRCCAFIGGLPVADDQIKLKKCHIAVGTPGRIKQLIQEGFLKTDAIRLFVLDEADKLLDDNFQGSINWIYNRLPASKQVLATSATYPESLAQLLTNYMQTPTFVRLNAQSPALLGLKQFYRLTEFHPSLQKCYENKLPSLMKILSSLPFGQCFIFSNYQLRAQALCDCLRSSGWPTAFISGAREQSERLRSIDKLKEFQCRILVSTDLTARGIDAENVDLVINLDVPWDTETYLHRIGRAGRYGSTGIAVTLASKGEEQKWLKEIEQNAKLSIYPLPDRVTEDLWKSSATSDSSKAEVVTTINGHDHEGHPGIDETVVVGAGLIESLNEIENLRLDTLGQKLKRDKLMERGEQPMTTTRTATDTNDVFEKEWITREFSKLFEKPPSTKTRFTYEQIKQFHRQGEPIVVAEGDELTSDYAVKPDDEEMSVALVESVVLPSRIDFYRTVKDELRTLCDDHRASDLRTSRSEFGRCLQYLASLTLPQLDGVGQKSAESSMSSTVHLAALAGVSASVADD